jgi:alpha-mannosidase
MRPADPGTDGPDLRAGLVFNFRFYPHDNSWEAARIPRVGWEATQPLLAYTVNDTWSPKSLPRRQSLVTATTRDGKGDALLTCLKQAEDGKGVIARWYESTGNPCQVEFMSGKAQRVDLQERRVAGDGSTQIKGWEIVTFRVQSP